jgi:O-antigen/teichoic acid export membrane protein
MACCRETTSRTQPSFHGAQTHSPGYFDYVEIAPTTGMVLLGDRNAIDLLPENSELTVTKPLILATMTKNALANLLRMGSSWTIILFLPPLLVRVLDKPTYGIWMLLLQVAGYVTLIDTGIQMAIARYVARAESLRDGDYMTRILSGSGVILITASFATILLTALASWRLNHLFHSIPPSISHSAQQALLVIGVSFALTLPFSTLAGFFAGLQKNEINAVAGSLGKFAGALGTAWAAYHHQGLLAMALWTGLGSFVQCSMYLFFWTRNAKPGLLRPSQVNGSMVRELLSFCSTIFVSQFCMLLISGLDMPIVVAFDFRSAAYYAVAITLSNFLSVPHGAIVSTVMPVAAGIGPNETAERIGQILQKATRFATAILCLTTLPLLLVMPLFLRIWVGQDYAQNTLNIAEILVVAQFIRLTMLPYATIGYAAGQLQRMLVAPISEAIVNVLFSLIAVRVIGAQGVAIGTLVGAVVSVTLHFLVSLPRTDCLVVSRRKLAWDGIIKPLAYPLPLFIISRAIIRSTSGPFFQLLTAATAELVLFFLFWKFTFEIVERRQVKEVLRHTFDRSAVILRALRTG